MEENYSVTKQFETAIQLKTVRHFTQKTQQERLVQQLFEIATQAAPMNDYLFKQFLYLVTGSSEAGWKQLALNSSKLQQTAKTQLFDNKCGIALVNELLDLVDLKDDMVDKFIKIFNKIHRPKK